MIATVCVNRRVRVFARRRRQRVAGGHDPRVRHAPAEAAPLVSAALVCTPHSPHTYKLLLHTL